MLTRLAPAKINLALHVTGQREDGYHLLDTLVVFTKLGDRISFEEPHHSHGPVAVSIDGPFGEGLNAGPQNLVTHAAMLMQEAVKREGITPRPVLIHLEKNLPLASGIGGGSADAAATLLGLQEYWQSKVDLFALAAALGADVAMCLHSQPLRARGIGDKIDLLAISEPLHMVLVNPNVAVSTPEVFKALETRDGSPLPPQEIATFPDIEEISEMRNDLQKPAISIQPVIAEVLARLTHSSPLVARMSGSGATCFAIYKTSEQAGTVQQELARTHPHWWSVATSVLPAI